VSVGRCGGALTHLTATVTLPLPPAVAEQGKSAVHSYTPRWPAKADLDNLPRIAEVRFNSTADVIDWAERDRLIGWKTWPEVWHLDDAGEVRCYYKASSCDSIQRWADDPHGLFASRNEGIRSGGCTDRWLIIESRNLWGPDEPIVSEGDAAGFVEVRRLLADIGVLLVEDVIFDDAHHWWSMNELTSGSLAWPIRVAEVLQSAGDGHSGARAAQRRQRGAAARRGRRAGAGDGEWTPGG
jgi:hypothetical protein